MKTTKHRTARIALDTDKRRKGLFDLMPPAHVSMRHVRVGDLLFGGPSEWWKVLGFGEPKGDGGERMVPVFVEREGDGRCKVDRHYVRGVPFARCLVTNVSDVLRNVCPCGECGVDPANWTPECRIEAHVAFPEAGDFVFLPGGDECGKVKRCLCPTKPGDPGAAANSGDWAVEIETLRDGLRVVYVEASSPRQWVAGGGEREPGVPAWIAARVA
jgi:hypothetical protein